MSNKNKPLKPYPGFPLYAHAVGQWAKKIKGKVYYFGPWSNPDAALAKYLERRDELYLGKAVAKLPKGVTLDYLVNSFLESKHANLEAGFIVKRTYDDYFDVCRRLLAIWDRELIVDELTPKDFEALKVELSKTRGVTSLLNDITRIRVLFNYGVQTRLIQAPHYGGQFQKPTRKMLRQAKQERGKVMFEPYEIQALIAEAKPTLRAMIYLGINCGYGNGDCVALKPAHLQDGWAVFPRPKTGIERRCPLWPETQEAIEACRKEDHIFLTKGGKFYDHRQIGVLFRRLCRANCIYRKGIGFYALRHTFFTIGSQRDEIAARYIMGHAPKAEDMSAVYRETITDDRLRAVTDFVYEWLFQRYRLRLVG